MTLSTSFAPAASAAEAPTAGPGGDDPGFGVYVHWPYCKAKCPYCDFNSHVAEAIDHPGWRDAYAREIAYAAANEAPGQVVTSIFFGGGTPSLMPPATVEAILDEIARHWPVASDAEITLEANPTSVEVANFRALRTAGVNRVSVGVQALNDADLTALGRQHTAEVARRAVAAAGEVFPRHSFDLIYGRPGQSVDAWDAELAEALALAGEHLALYQLTIEDGTAFAERFRKGELVLPPEEDLDRMFEVTQARTDAAGLPAYEISNHARPGGECRHNQLYWRYADYVGIGPGAHGRVTRAGTKYALRRHRSPTIWLNRARRHGHGTQQDAALDPEDRLVEMLMMGLRTAEGLPRPRWLAELGAAPEALLDGQGLADLDESGDLVLDDAGLRATAAGRQRLNSVLAYLLA